MLHLAKGPTAWANASDLWRMGKDCSIGRSFHCIRARGQAAMLRTYYYENWERPIREEVRDLVQCEAVSNQHDRIVHWREWFGRSFPRGLLQNKDQMETKNISMKGIREKLCSGMDVCQDQKQCAPSFRKRPLRRTCPSSLRTGTREPCTSWSGGSSPATDTTMPRGPSITYRSWANWWRLEWRLRRGGSLGTDGARHAGPNLVRLVF